MLNKINVSINKISQKSIQIINKNIIPTIIENNIKKNNNIIDIQKHIIKINIVIIEIHIKIIVEIIIIAQRNCISVINIQVV